MMMICRNSAGVGTLWAVRRFLLNISGESVTGCIVHSPPVSSGISWSVRETELSSQSTEKGVADTPSIIKSNSGYSVSSFFKGETGPGHMTHKQSGVGHMTDVESATLQEKLKEDFLRRTSCPSVKVSLNSE